MYITVQYQPAGITLGGLHSEREACIEGRDRLSLRAEEEVCLEEEEEEE